MPQVQPKKWQKDQKKKKVVEFKCCELKMGTCHLPLQGLNQELPQLLTLNIPNRVQHGDQE